MAAAKATVSGIQSMKKPGCGEVKSIQELHSEITDKMQKIVEKVNRKVSEIKTPADDVAYIDPLEFSSVESYFWKRKWNVGNLA